MDSDKSDKITGSSPSGRGYRTFNPESESSIAGSTPAGPIFSFILISIMLFCSNSSDKNAEDNTDINKRYYNLIEKDSITIYWDAVSNFFDTVQYYEVFYKTESEEEWHPVKMNAPVSDSPNVIVYRNDLESNDSIFFFGVRSVTIEGVRSDIHSCTDSTAYPSNWGLFGRINLNINATLAQLFRASHS